jgi:outer membrane protein assembly factor BamE (lipoprotein component of BamABCDE complex)
MKTGYFLIIFILGIATSLVAGVDSIQVSQTDQINNQASTNRVIRANWRKLSIGMSQVQVIKILGEPSRVTVDSLFTIWYYESFGNVSFSRGAVDGWREPL